VLVLLLNILYCFLAVFSLIFGILVLAAPEVIIKINDWWTEKTILHETKGIIFRIIVGIIMLIISFIFWCGLLAQ
jgi:hypothetical protein